MRIVKKDFVAKFFPKRPSWSRKGNFGRLLVIGGNNQYSGSVALASMAAYRTGCDLVSVLAPERAANISACYSPDMITIPVKAKSFNPWHVKEALKLSEKAHAVVIGGGLGKEKQTLSFVQKFLEKNTRPCLIDADAITAVAAKPKILKGFHILSPHSREFFVLTGLNLNNKTKDRVMHAKRAAQDLGCTILLKGHIDIITDGKKVLVSRTGNPNMSVGGTGDVLAGIVGALLARGLKPVNAAAAGAYINGVAGNLVSREKGFGLIASDLLEKIPLCLR